MKRSLLIITICVIAIAACTNENKIKQVKDTAEAIATDTTFSATIPQKSSSNCYEYIKNRDTVLLKINIDGEELTGNLDYKLFEKDHNTGTIAGEMKGDTIIAEYTFDSEGLRSIREVVFVKKDDGKIYEGMGEVIDKGGKMVFKDRSSLQFNPAIVFSKTNCK